MGSALAGATEVHCFGRSVLDPETGAAAASFGRGGGRGRKRGGCFGGVLGCCAPSRSLPPDPEMGGKGGGGGAGAPNPKPCAGAGGGEGFLQLFAGCQEPALCPGHVRVQVIRRSQ